MLHSESLQNPTELWVGLSILWEHFDEVDTGNRASEGVHLYDDSSAPSAGMWNIVISNFLSQRWPLIGHQALRPTVPRRFHK